MSQEPEVSPFTPTRWHDTIAAAEERVADFLRYAHKGYGLAHRDHGPDARDKAAIRALAAEMLRLRALEAKLRGALEDIIEARERYDNNTDTRFSDMYARDLDASIDAGRRALR